MSNEYTVQWGEADTRITLERAGYVFRNYSQCKQCHRPIQWFRTPKGKNKPWDMPKLDPTSVLSQHEQPIRSHFQTCPATPTNRAKAKSDYQAALIKAASELHRGVHHG